MSCDSPRRPKRQKVGYVLIGLNAEQCRADYRIVPYVTKAGSPVRTHSSWVVENNRRGVRKM